jgi:iron complex outermembrane recepter protein
VRRRRIQIALNQNRTTNIIPIGLRAISAGDGNTFGDQAVAFNIDGVQIARSTPQQFSDFDLQQVEVLKGPQALYFGKNSLGGIVVLHSGDPTSHLQAGTTGTYEFIAHGWRGEGFVSGPITDSIGGRIAVFGETMRGWVKNITTAGTSYSPNKKYANGQHEFGARDTQV